MNPTALRRRCVPAEEPALRRLADVSRSASGSWGLPNPAHALFLLSLCGLGLLLPLRSADNDNEERGAEPLILEAEGLHSTHTSALRGCRGAPVDFRWITHEGAPVGSEALKAVAGRPLRTKVLAFDQWGRPVGATGSGCGDVGVKLHLGGEARLSHSPSWVAGELALDFQDDTAEVVEVRLHLASPSRGANSTLLQLRLHFQPGMAAVLRLAVQPLAQGCRGTPMVLQGPVAWPTQLVLAVSLTGSDARGNPLDGADILRMGHFRLASGGSLEHLNQGLFQQTETGKACALVRSTHSGSFEVELEPMGSTALQDDVLRGARRLLAFTGPPAVGIAALESGASPQWDPMQGKEAEWRGLAAEVREAFLHAWRGYKRFAWGADELQPLSKQGRNSFGKIGMTILDSLTTLHMMGLHEDFEEGAAFVKDQLQFDSVDQEVSVFELIIRALGGLLGAYSLTERKVFLERAVELADLLLPALNTSSGLPVPKWNLHRSSAVPSSEPTILAEAGSLQLEFRQLTAFTGDQRYRRTADACFEAIQSTGVVGLVPVQLTPPHHYPPQALATKYAVGALADSYYEYLLKQWLQSPEEKRFKDLWLTVMQEFPALVWPKPGSTPASSAPPLYKLVELTPSGAAVAKMDHLSCFVPGMIALALMNLPASDLAKGQYATWLQLAEGLLASCVELWTSMKSGLAPEYVLLMPKPPFSVRDVPAGARHSFLRPETAESLFYLHRLTGKDQYREWGAKLFHAILSNSRVEAGFASVADVNKVPTDKLDDMQSFVMAETFKYLYLLFSPTEALDLSSYILNTEAHPLRKPEAVAV